MLDARVLRTREDADSPAASASVPGQRSMVEQAATRMQSSRTGNSRRGSRLWRVACVLLAMVPLSSAGAFAIASVYPYLHQGLMECDSHLCRPSQLGGACCCPESVSCMLTGVSSLAPCHSTSRVPCS